MWSTIGCTVIGQTWKTYLQNLHISRRFYWNRILWRHLLLERKRRKSEDSGLWKEINKSIAGLKKFPVRVQTIVYIIYIVCIVWDQRGSKCNINNDSVSKELQPETPGNVNGHDETPVSYPANRVVDVDKNQCWAIETKSILIWIPIFFQIFPTCSHAEAAPSNQGLLVRGVATVEALCESAPWWIPWWNQLKPWYDWDPTMIL